MSLLVQPHAALGEARPSDYEQLINYTMLYDSGDECEEVTGGLGTNGYSFSNGTAITQGTKNSNNIYFDGKTRTHVFVGTLKSIDLSNYTNFWGIGMATSIVMSGNTPFGISTCISNTKVISDFTFENIGYSVTNNKLCLNTDITNLPYSEGYVSAYAGSADGCDGYIYNMFLTKPDDIGALCYKAGVGTPTSIESLLADTDSLATIFNNEDAVKFMVAQCTGDFMVGVLNSADAVELLKESPYLNLVIANPHWAKFMMMIPNAKELLGYTMLYDEGDECTDVTGGWDVLFAQNASYGSVAKNADHLYMYGNKSGFPAAISYAYTKNEVAVRGKKVFAILSCYGTVTNPGFPWLSCGTSSADTSLGVVTFAPTSTENKRAFSITPSGNGFVSFRNAAGGKTASENGSSTMKIYTVAYTIPDNWQTLCSKAGITAPTDITTLVADSSAMATIMSNEEAVKYLMGCTGDLMVAICNSEVAMAALVNNIAYDYAFAHPVWYKFMTMIPTALAAMDSVAVTVPTMTSNTTPSGVASASSIYNTVSDAWCAFDRDVATPWSGAKGQNAVASWIGYTWGFKIALYKIEASPAYMSGHRGDCLPSAFKIQGLDDNNEWVDVETFVGKTISNQSSAFTDVYILGNALKAYKGYRIYATGAPTYGSGADSLLFGELQFYGKAVNE